MKTVPILAVDGGGTRCRGAICNEKGEVIAYAEAGPVNYQNIGEVNVEIAFIELLQKLVAQSGENDLKIKQALLGIAGIDTKQDQEIVLRIFTSALSKVGIETEELQIENDANMTLYGMSRIRPSLLVISGTGSIVCGINKNGEIARVGGWGHWIGDEGSGYKIAQTAVRHIFKVEDGQEPPSGIKQAVLKYLGLATVQDLMGWVYQKVHGIDEIAALAPLVFRLAKEGDEKSTEILERAALDLANACRAAIAKLKITREFDLFLGGGILQKHEEVSDTIIRELSDSYVVYPHILDKEPVYFALLFGLSKIGKRTNEAEYNCLHSLRLRQANWKTSQFGENGKGSWWNGSD